MWKTIERFGHKIGFTANESVVVAFLLVTLAGGYFVRLSISAGGENVSDIRAEYRLHDSAFHALATGAIDQTAKTAQEPNRASVQPAGIDINSADEDELNKLPGVGPATARKIIDYRDHNGRFRSVEEIMRVPSIGPKKFEAMKEYIRVR